MPLRNVAKNKRNSIYLIENRNFAYVNLVIIRPRKFLEITVFIVVEKILKMKMELFKIKTKLLDIEKQHMKNKVVLQDLRTIISQSCKFQTENLKDLKSTSNEFPTKQDLTGAVNGMVILRLAYYYNITLAVKEGKIRDLPSERIFALFKPIP